MYSQTLCQITDRSQCICIQILCQCHTHDTIIDRVCIHRPQTYRIIMTKQRIRGFPVTNLNRSVKIRMACFGLGIRSHNYKKAHSHTDTPRSQHRLRSKQKKVVLAKFEQTQEVHPMKKLYDFIHTLLLVLMRHLTELNKQTNEHIVRIARCVPLSIGLIVYANTSDRAFRLRTA